MINIAKTYGNTYTKPTINGQFFIHFILIAFPIKKPKTNFMYQVQTEIFIEPRYLLSDSKLETWPKPTIFKDYRGI